MRHPKDLLIGLGARITEISWIYVLTIFGLNYAVSNLGLPRGLVLGAIALGAALELITIPLFGHLSDRMGRRSDGGTSRRGRRFHLCGRGSRFL